MGFEAVGELVGDGFPVVGGLFPLEDGVEHLVDDFGFHSRQIRRLMVWSAAMPAKIKAVRW